MEAAATTTSQEYVQDAPLESRPDPLVDGGEVAGDVGHANIMARTIPKLVIFQSNLSNKYLHLDRENSNALSFAGDYSYGVDTRFEVVPATTGRGGHVHIRSLENNRYWVNSGNWITASADRAEENQSDIHCTLFEPVPSDNNNSLFGLRHVNTGYSVKEFQGVDDTDVHSGCLCLDPAVSNLSLCYFLDWEFIVVLPDLVRIKGDNGNYLKAYGTGFMKFESQANNSSMFDYKVYPSRDGGVRLQSVAFQTYWKVDTPAGGLPSVILEHPPSTVVHDADTVFIPTLLDGNRIIMQSLSNNRFCGRKHSGDILTVGETYPDQQYSSMDIELPIISRKIGSVRYHLADARLYDVKADVALISDDTTNRTQIPFTSQLNLKTRVTNTRNWSTGESLTTSGGSMITTTTFGVPYIESGELQISAEHTRCSPDWGREETETLEVGSVKTITVEPMSRVKGTLMATRLSYTIPFSYTVHDVLINGKKVSYQKNGGVFTAHNGYGYRYEIVPLPLHGDAC